MYWFRPGALALMGTVSVPLSTFPEELTQIDGTVSHAIERLIGLSSSTDGWYSRTTMEVVENEETTNWLAKGVYPFACATIDGEHFVGPVSDIR